MKSSHFNKIVVVQSLKDGELRTGSRLHEDLEMLNIAHGHKLDINIQDIDRKINFMQLLTDLTNGTKLNGLCPVLHIETHGSVDTTGLVLSSGDFISWTELKDPLINLNIATKNNLLVVLAVCNGAYLTEIIKLTDRAPCWGLIGPAKTIQAGVVLASFSAFYAELLKTGDGGQALRLLNEAVPEGQAGYYFTTAEIFFKRVFEKYLTVSCSKKALDGRARNMRKELKRLGSAIIPSMGQLKRKLAKANEPFEKYKKLFFMIDLYPENGNRFTIEYSDVTQ